MPIYTKTGDKGNTSLFDGTRVSKTNIRVASYGTVDELNSVIGVAIAHIENVKLNKLKTELEKIQHDLLDIGSGLAMPEGMPVVGLDKRIKELEILIDEFMDISPKIDQFILPGGAKAASFLHMARTITRRVERIITKLSQKERVDENIVKYINRLSDFLYACARFANFQENRKDIIWKKK